MLPCREEFAMERARLETRAERGMPLTIKTQ